jgi:glycosyltransferase involved in cell wall biosynthesis
VDVRLFAEGATIGACERAELRAALGLSGCVFLYVGRLWKKKGLDYLIEAYRQLREKGYDASLLLAGDGVDEAFYREMVGDLPNVVFLGFVQKPELPKWYGVADVMVFPTLGDPYGHVVQEAMAASRAVISSENAGDVRDRVLEGVTGFIVPVADAGALYEKMRTLTQDPELRWSMGQRGFDHMAPRTPQWWAGNFARMISQIQRGQPAAEHMYM